MYLAIGLMNLTRIKSGPVDVTERSGVLVFHSRLLV